jgi:hypothetical protein
MFQVMVSFNDALLGWTPESSILISWVGGQIDSQCLPWIEFA